ncbi:hypothetical protein J8F10_06685 [Gemmata sp. G18]|uniref:Helix-turn-helix domain-containing protein n=1 Tax=Gemmata palustris TaxID=2822762 RepID=A0ABS5BMM7_9BACT|nr:hypothetical protein [Gemmata palustris]MBP3954967.1 hypothetical protein [Gemmata palustris]
MPTERTTRPVPPKLVEIWERLDVEPLPEFTQSIPGLGLLNKKRRLAALCYELSGRAWGGQFLLSGTQAGVLAGVDQGTISNWLREFETLRLIVCVRKGDPRKRIASVYVWVHHTTTATRVLKYRKPLELTAP